MDFLVIFRPKTWGISCHNQNPRFRLLLLVILTLFVFISCTSSLTYLEGVLLIQKQSSAGVYVCSIVNTPNWVRSLNLYEKWGQKFITKFPNSVFKYVSSSPNKVFKDMTILVTGYPPGYRSFFYFFNRAVEDFLENTSLPWMYRTTEDCLVDVDMFEKYMLNLSKKYSPNEIVIKGHGVMYSKELFFVHGGSGWVMSREACKEYMRQMKNITKIYKSTSSMGDDVLFGFFAQHTEFNFSELDDPYFLGSPYSDEEIQVVNDKNWTSLPKCSTKIKYALPIVDIIFWHSGRRDNYPISIGIEAKNVYPPNVYYDQYSSPRRLCQRI